MIKKVSLIFMVVLLVTSSCDDPELNALMDDYCECISKARYDESLRYECIEKMDSIKTKYENAPRKLQQVLEKTDECY